MLPQPISAEPGRFQVVVSLDDLPEPVHMPPEPAVAATDDGAPRREARRSGRNKPPSTTSTFNNVIVLVTVYIVVQVSADGVFEIQNRVVISICST